MQKVYLLLRDNRQSGPFSLEELKALGTRPDDLIWIEGKSSGWLFPSEVEGMGAGPFASHPAPVPAAHQPYLPADDAPPARSQPETGRHIFVALPGEPAPPAANARPPETDKALEENTATPSRKAAAYPAAQAGPLPESTARSWDHPAAERSFSSHSSASLSYERKKPAANRGWILGTLALVLLAAGYLLGRETAPAAGEGGAEKNNGLQRAALPGAGETNTDPGEEPVRPDESVSFVSQEESRPPAEKRKEAGMPAVTDKRSDEAEGGEQTAAEKMTIAAGPESASPPVTEAADEATEEPAAAPPPAEKKKKGGLLDRFRRNKDEQAGAKETGSKEPANRENYEKPDVSTRPAPGTAERRAVRRDETAAATNSSPAPAEPVDLTGQVSVSATAPAHDWMMGVQGLKLTLRNRSNATIKTAAVEVRYYNESNELIDKKLVYFSNVPPNKSATVSAPDHRIADHADHRVVSVIGK